MSKLFLLSWIIFCIPGVMAQGHNFDTRIKKVDNLADDIPRIQEHISHFKSEVENYKNPKIIKKDQDILKSILENVAGLKKRVDEAVYSLRTEKLKQDIKDLEKIIEERKKYEDTLKKIKEIEKKNSYSKRLDKYIQSIKQNKHNQAQVIYYSLNYDEKKIADKYNDMNSYLIRDKNIQNSLDQNISQMKNKIDHSLTFPEKAVKEIGHSLVELEQQKSIFKDLLGELALDQYDFKLETWSLGLFNCKSQAGYYRSVNFPDMLLLKNEQELISVIKLNPDQRTSYEVLYACKKKGSFGGCLDNEKKQLCHLDENCREKLSVMEMNYNRNEFFLKLHTFFPSELLIEKQKEYRDQEKFTLLRGMSESNKLGYYSLEELNLMIDPIIEFSKSIQAKTPEEYFKKINIEIDKNKKKMINQIPKVIKGTPSATKMADTKKAINYLFMSLSTQLEAILENDKIQERTFQGCSLLDFAEEGYCKSEIDWRGAVKVFQRLEEIQNLVPGECPRGVFRLSEVERR